MRARVENFLLAGAEGLFEVAAMNSSREDFSNPLHYFGVDAWDIQLSPKIGLILPPLQRAPPVINFTSGQK